MATVAVVVPVYNHGQFLHAALDSLMAQTYKDWECVIIDDGSTAGDLSWVPHRVIRQTNQGVGSARNRGIAETTAPLLAFLDQDDLWRPTYLARQVEQFADSEVVLSSTDFDIIDAEGAKIRDGYEGHHASYEDLLTGCGIALSAAMVRRQSVERVAGFRPFPVAQDWDLWLRLLRHGGRAARVEKQLVSWREHGTNASRQYRQLWLDSKAILADHRHPSARIGRRRMRVLSGAQALNRARESKHLEALAWAGTHAPKLTARQILRRLVRSAR